jgi:GMP synthase-like glutamine amidotransferase
VTARDDDGTIMALEHGPDRLYGVQFHPESILTEHGFRLLANFLDAAGIPRHHDLPEVETQAAQQAHDAGDGRIVTF